MNKQCLAFNSSSLYCSNSITVKLLFPGNRFFGILLPIEVNIATATWMALHNILTSCDWLKCTYNQMILS